MPEKVISNTTPIITLLGIGKFELLKAMYREITIPEAVYLEIEKGKHKAFYTDVNQYDWIQIVKVKNTGLVNHLKLVLDEGEAEVIALAEEMNADLLLIDEKLARKYARLRDFRHTGSFGILLKAKDMNLITEIKPLLMNAIDNGIRLSDKLIMKILTEANEI